MTDLNFCLSSYMAFRYIWKDGMDFREGFQHKNFRPIDERDRIPCRTSTDIDREISRQFEQLYRKYDNIGILLSGGMDSANLASYLKPGSHAYTFTSQQGGVFNADIERSKAYCAKWGLIHHFVDISMEDYEKYTPFVMRASFTPVHSIEPQIYKAALAAKADGVQLMIHGDSADPIFGGMDKLISKEWTFEAFVKRYTFLDPKLVLTTPVDMSELFEQFRLPGGMIDYMRFMEDVYSIESSGSYMNAFGAAWMPSCDPYAILKLGEPMDLECIRSGETKYLIRGLYAMKYPEREVPTKIPMPRPVDIIFQDWEGPKRPEFRKDIPMNELTGNQKWQLWCAEQFLNLLYA